MTPDEPSSLAALTAQNIPAAPPPITIHLLEGVFNFTSGELFTFASGNLSLFSSGNYSLCKKIRVGLLRRLDDRIIRQDIGLILLHANVMFEMNGNLVVGGTDGPAVALGVYVPFAQVDHGLDGQHQPFLQFGAGAATAIVRHLRLLMQLFSKAMTHQFPHHAIALPSLGMFLDGIGDITHAVACNGLLDPFV